MPELGLPTTRMQPQKAPGPQGKSFWRSATLWLSLAGSLLLWAAFPPLALWPLAWIAPVPWLWLVLLPELPDRRPYLAIWLAGFAHWLLLLQGIRLAHPALYGGWLALSWYLAFYLPAFIVLSRVAVHRLRVPIMIAAPVVWVGLELIRGHLITGFSLALLAHTQAERTLLVQISDLGGAYTVSFVVMAVAAAIGRVVQLEPWGRPPLPRTLTPALAAAVLLAATLGYGGWRLHQLPPNPGAPSVRIALIQGSRDTRFDNDQQYVLETLEHYQQLTDQARRENPRLDLVVWPESMFVVPEIQIREPLQPPNGIAADSYRRNVEASGEQFAAVLAQETARVNTLPGGTRQSTPTLLLIGTNTYVVGPHSEQHSYNSALLADPSGKITDRYYKQHAVMFGEYIPFGDVLPIIYELTPLHDGLSVGERPESFRVGGLNFSPSICFESVVPHLVRRQVLELARRGEPADVLVNVTNDGWFWGSSILDLHSRCAVFRAIENRKPLVVAANTGISTWIDGNGVTRARGPRRAPAILIADVQPDGRTSPYAIVGDLPAWACAAACVMLALVGFSRRSAGSARCESPEQTAHPGTTEARKK